MAFNASRVTTNLLGRQIRVVGQPVPLAAQDVHGETWVPPVLEPFLNRVGDIVAMAMHDGDFRALVNFDGRVFDMNLTGWREWIELVPTCAKNMPRPSAANDGEALGGGATAASSPGRR
jgi:hypothetical protein